MSAVSGTVHIYGGKVGASAHLASMQLKFDGEPAALGIRLAKFLKSGALTDATSLNKDMSQPYFLSAGHLAAKFVADCREDIGNGRAWLTVEIARGRFNYFVIVPTMSRISAGEGILVYCSSSPDGTSTVNWVSPYVHG